MKTYGSSTKKSEACFWTAEEIDLAQDYNDWTEKLNDDERFFLKHILCFFAASDGIVNENLCENFAVECTNQEVRQFYGFQIAMENIHSETYGLLIKNLIRNANEQLKCFTAIETNETIKKKAVWALNHMHLSSSFAAKARRLCLCGGHIFQQFLRYLLAQETQHVPRHHVF